MSSLKEKAMSVSCPKCKGFGYYIVDDQRNQEKCDWCNGTGVIDMLRLEDAQKEIDRLEKQIEKEITIRCGYSEQIVELKQKLQQLLSEFPRKLWDEAFEWRDYATEEVDEWKKKFEELLKLDCFEKKEVKRSE